MLSSKPLTSYPIGSKREFWGLMWPLMIGFLATSFMMFADRFFLAQYDLMALNAASSAGMAYWIFLVLPFSVSAIAEVLAGRLHGEQKLQEIGSATWQMVWFSFLISPIFLCIGFIAPYFLFSGTGNEIYETSYFQTLILFAPAQCAAIALSGFFIGIGNVSIVTYSALLGNLINIILDYFLIFGWNDIIPSFGINGAAIATGIAEIIQLCFLLLIFWSKKNKKNYHTFNLQWNLPLISEGLKIGFPIGLGRCIEVTAHFIFLRIIMSTSTEQMTIVAVIQSLYLLGCFITESEGKAASAIISNLLGANDRTPISKVLKSSFILHFFFFIAFMCLTFLFPNTLIELFNNSENSLLLNKPEIANTFYGALFWMSIYFLIDGFCWILISFLTSAGDSKFVLWVSILVHWCGYVLPSLLLIGYGKGGADTAWAIIAFMGLLNLLIYLWRYLSGKWLIGYKSSSLSSQKKLEILDYTH